METKLVNGDYVPDGLGGVERLSGADALLGRVLYRLTARRGQFPPLPELGSELYRLGRWRPSQRESMAKQYAVQALTDEPELTVTEARLAQDGTLQVQLEWRGEKLTLTMELGG